MELIDLAEQYKSLESKINERMLNVLKHGQYIMGPEVIELESKLSAYINVKHTITCANGTDALTLALMTLGATEGDAVFCPTFTYFATAESIAFLNATPIFVDSNKKTFNICPFDLEEKIKKVIDDGKLRPKAIIAVDLFGLPADYHALRKLAGKYSLKIIEDAAQGFGGEIEGQKAGSFGDISTTSFFPSKPLGCYGDGGAIFTNNDEYAELLKSLRVHGKGKDKYDNVRIGMNSRLDTIQSAILLEKLNAFPEEIKIRDQVAKIYMSRLKKSYQLPNIPSGYFSSWAQFTIATPNRYKVIQNLRSKNIPTAIYYSKCMHEQQAFKHLKQDNSSLQNSENLSKTVLSLPIFRYLRSNEEKNLEIIINALNNV